MAQDTLTITDNRTNLTYTFPSRRKQSELWTSVRSRPARKTSDS